jgi:nucleotidyltransferase/DNA polymerase involved in DNA repair
MFATIYVPNFYLQAGLRHQLPYRGTAVSAVTPTGHTDKMSVPQPVALIDEKDKKPVIIELNPAAEAAGVSKGMTPSQGLARCLNLVIKTRSPSQEKSIEAIVLHYAFTLSPYVETTGPGVYTVQFTNDRELLSKGAWHRHPADETWAGSPCHKLSRVIDQLAECDVIAQAGLSRTPDSSFLAAHLARPVLEIKEPKKFLAPLPIDTLAIASDS